MNKPLVSEIGLSSVILMLLVLLLNPFSFWMPNMAHMLVIVGLIAIFGVFSLFVWNEQPDDEREQLHLMRASRTAYLIAGIFLVIGIGTQSLKDEIDPWLPITLTSMIVAKIISQARSRARH